MNRRVWYVYPLLKRVSFSLIAQRHIKELRQYFTVEEIDELAFPLIVPFSNPVVLIHPYFYVMMHGSKYLSYKLPKYKAIIGVDVADSNRISSLAVSMTDYADAMIVPSNFSKKSYVDSGVKVPVYVVPHGLDDEYFSDTKYKSDMFNEMYRIKGNNDKIFLLSFIIHSDYRKGLDLVLDFYRQLKKERPNVVLVLKRAGLYGSTEEMIRRLGGIVVAGWLKEEQKLALYDLCDIYLLFSRGGGFEHNGLEALARGLVVLGARGGAWEDYMPEWGLLPSKPSGEVLPGNPVHTGTGVEVIIDKAVDEAIKIIDNLEEYKAKVKEYRDKVLKHRFRWSVIGRQLRDIIAKYI